MAGAHAAASLDRPGHGVGPPGGFPSGQPLHRLLPEGAPDRRARSPVTAPTPVTPIDAGTAVGHRPTPRPRRLPARRPGRPPRQERCRGGGRRRHPGRGRPGLVATGHRVGGRRAPSPTVRPVVVRPSTTAQVSTVLAACNEAVVPVTPVAGRSGVCGGSIPVFGGVALDLTSLDGLLAVDETSLTADVRAGIFGPDLEGALAQVGTGYTLGHWPQSMELSTVGGMARLPRCGSVLHPLRQDRGHGARPRGGPGRRPHRAHRRARPPCRHRAQPDPALRGQRGHPRRDHRSAPSHPPASAGPGSARLRLHAPSTQGWRPAGRSCGVAPRPPSCASTTRPSPSVTSSSPTPTCSSCWTRPTRHFWPPRSRRRRRRVHRCRGRPRPGPRPGRALARPPATTSRPWHRCGGPASWWTRRRSRRRGPCFPRSSTRCSSPSGRWRARWSPRPTSPTPTPMAPACTSPSPAGDPKVTTTGGHASTAGPGTP